MDDAFVRLLTPYLNYLGDRKLTPNTRLHEFGLDSMRSIELVLSLEDSFGIEFPDDRLNDATFATAGSLWSVVQLARTTSSPAGAP